MRFGGGERGMRLGGRIPSSDEKGRKLEGAREEGDWKEGSAQLMKKEGH
jgi:hypothetical protein